MVHLPTAGTIAVLLAVAACGRRGEGRIDTTALARTPAGPVLRIAILGDSGDSRVPQVHEAIEHWNGELARLGRRVRLVDGGIVASVAPPEDALRAASEALLRSGPESGAAESANARLRAALATVPADVVIVLSRGDLISFGLTWDPAHKGIIALRSADRPPLSLPNTVRNVVAHELGHTMGLDHNADSTTLMCGRPAPCRPRAFVSDVPRFFPLTAQDEARVRDRWP